MKDLNNTPSLGRGIMSLLEVEESLEEIGLTRSEIKVYLALLELGPSTTGPIIDESQTANSKVYAILEKLIRKGLVTHFVQKKLKYYKASKPAHLLHYLEDQKQKIVEQEKKVENILPHLNQLFTDHITKSEAVVYCGPKGIRTAFHDLIDSLEEGDHVNIMGVHNFGKEFKRQAMQFQKLRSLKNIKGNFLINENAKGMADSFAKYPPLEVRFMEEGIITPAIFMMYKDKVIINLADDMVFFVLSSQRAVDAFNSYFQNMWEKASRYIQK